MARERKYPVKFEVPMIVNSHQLPNDISFDKVTIPLDSLKRRYLVGDKIDKEPCYQRDTCWSPSKERAFIQSCFNPNMAIPPLYLAKQKGSGKKKWVAVDGRQRLTAICNFFDGKHSGTDKPFWVRITVTYNDGTTTSKRLTWGEIEENEDYSDLRDQLLNRPVEIVQFGAMSYEEQRKIFVALNNGVPLNSDEENYCPNFLMRRALEDIFEIVFKSKATVNYNHDEDNGQPGPGLASVLQTMVRNERRFSHLRVMHECLILTTGISKAPKSDDDNNDRFVLGDAIKIPDTDLFYAQSQPRSCKRTDRKSSAEAVHDSMSAAGLEYDRDITDTDTIIELMGINDQIVLLRDIADQLAVVFDQNETLGRKPAAKSETGFDKYCLPRQVVDALCFMYTIVQDGHWTLGKVKGMRSRLAKWLAVYYKLKTTVGDYNMATSDALTMAGKYRIMRLTFNKMFGEDIPKWIAEDAISQDAKKTIDIGIKEAKLRRIP